MEVLLLDAILYYHKYECKGFCSVNAQPFCILSLVITAFFKVGFCSQATSMEGPMQ